MLHTVTYAANVYEVEKAAINTYRLLMQVPATLTDDQIRLIMHDEDAEMVGGLMSALRLYGEMFTPRVTRADGERVIEVICCDHWSVNDSNVCATCWIDDNSRFYFEY